jgi:putative copper resistance protein D
MASQVEPQAAVSAPAVPRPGAARLLVAAVLIPIAVGVVSVLRIGAHGYASVGLPDPGPATALTAVLARAVAVLASTACLGGLAAAVLLRPGRERQRLVVEASGAIRLASAAGVVWALAATVLVPVDAADSVGRPLGPIGSWADPVRLTASPLPLAWLVAAVCAAAVAATAALSRAWTTNALMLPVAALGVLAPLMVGQVLIGPGHDFAGDATVLGAPAEAVWFGTTAWLLGAGLTFRGRAAPGVLSRYLRLAMACWALVFTTQGVVAAVELAGTSPAGTATGRWFTVQFTLLASLGVLLLRRWRVVADSPVASEGCRDRGTRRFLAASTLIAAGCLAAELARTRIPPPQYFVPTSATQSFLGYDLRSGPSVAELFLHWRVNLLFCTLAVCGVGAYLAGARRLALRGDRWPVGRTVGWLVGWLFVVLTTCSGIGRFSGGTFSAHMALHMSLNMVAPLFLVLGAPLTLVLRTARAHPPAEPPGPREWATALRSCRFAKVLCHPVHALAAFTASSYLLYFSGLFEYASRYHWAHILMNLVYLGVGYLFFSLIIGVDAPPRPLPHPARFGLIMAAMPFHAFFGVVVMTNKGVIARGFYQQLSGDLTWLTDLHHDQYLGGGIAWSAGEVPLTVAVIALLVQWSRQDGRQAARVDRHLDAGLDTSYDAYNAMLARLAAADARGGGRATPPEDSRGG